MPETNTFHMYHDEMTITLQDIAFITGLPFDGATIFDWGQDTSRILGKTPGTEEYAKDGQLKMTWLKRRFSDPDKIVSSDVRNWKQYSCAYALACIRSFLMVDRSGAAVLPAYLLLLERVRPDDDQHFTWRAAALAWLYCEMGHSIFCLENHGKGTGGDIGGWMVLLEAWVLERFPSIAQRTHDDRRRGPDGHDQPRLKK
ncbi:Protein MAIN-LIKE 2 [Linum grandiflorum]